jgi:Protein kinase domain
MAFQKREIIISATLVLSIAVLFIIGSTKLISNGNSLGTTIGYSFIYFTVCYLYIHRISTVKRRILVVALSIVLITVTISLHFFIYPRSWDFQDRVIFDIDTTALAAFLLINFTHDRRIVVLLTAFTAEVDLLFYNREDSRQLNQIFTVLVSIIVYIILSIYHVKQIWDRRWKVAAIMLIFAFTVIMGIILRIYWYHTETLFALSASINACLSVVPWLWLMFVPKIKAWWQVYFDEEIIQDEQYNFLEMAGLPTKFTIKQIETATSNFQTPIGEGASGAVFKGTLEDGSVVAVKRIKWRTSGETEFKTELTIIASRQHVNLVRLLGFCVSPRGDYYLIYPFLQNGSLDAWLFIDDKKSHLSWALRYRIAIDVAKALAYLHHECHHRILHLDIKPANILLDEHFRALLSDFGISKLIGKDESSVITRARGTVIIWIIYLFFLTFLLPRP